MKSLKDLSLREQIMVVGILLIAMAVLAIPIFSDDIYLRKTTVDYDGCIETYLDGRLQGEECPKPDPYEQWFPNIDTNWSLNIT